MSNCKQLLTINRSWLTGFIFASQDYNRGGACQLFGPPGATNCHLKWANQAFLFLGL
jgi:hypothetical protein